MSFSFSFNLFFIVENNENEKLQSRQIRNSRNNHESGTNNNTGKTITDEELKNSEYKYMILNSSSS